MLKRYSKLMFFSCWLCYRWPANWQNCPFSLYMHTIFCICVIYMCVSLVCMGFFLLYSLYRFGCICAHVALKVAITCASHIRMKIASITSIRRAYSKNIHETNEMFAMGPFCETCAAVECHWTNNNNNNNPNDNTKPSHIQVVARSK